MDVRDVKKKDRHGKENLKDKHKTGTSKTSKTRGGGQRRYENKETSKTKCVCVWDSFLKTHIFIFFRWRWPTFAFLFKDTRQSINSSQCHPVGSQGGAQDGGHARVFLFFLLRTSHSPCLYAACVQSLATCQRGLRVARTWPPGGATCASPRGCRLESQSLLQSQTNQDAKLTEANVAHFRWQFRWRPRARGLPRELLYLCSTAMGQHSFSGGCRLFTSHHKAEAAPFFVQTDVDCLGDHTWCAVWR